MSLSRRRVQTDAGGVGHSSWGEWSTLAILFWLLKDLSQPCINEDHGVEPAAEERTLDGGEAGQMICNVLSLGSPLCFYFLLHFSWASLALGL